MNELARMQAEMIDEMAREQIALFCLGEKGEHFDGDEWGRRADELHGRAKLAEARIAREIAR